MRDAGHRTPDIGRRTSDGEKSKNNISTPQGGGHKYQTLNTFSTVCPNMDKLTDQSCAVNSSTNALFSDKTNTNEAFTFET